MRVIRKELIWENTKNHSLNLSFRYKFITLFSSYVIVSKTLIQSTCETLLLMDDEILSPEETTDSGKPKQDKARGICSKGQACLVVSGV